MSLSICFVDGTLEFDAATPLERPLGGTQSAAAYLAAALVQRGHRVTLLSKIASPRTVMGVDCRPVSELEHGLGRSGGFDCFVFISQIERFADLTAWFTPDTLRVLWSGDNVDQPTTAPLARQEVRSFYHRVVCVSHWHRGVFLPKFGGTPDGVRAIRNGIGASFEGLFASAQELRGAKSGSPRLAYTSTPFRGLSMLLEIVPAIRQVHADAELDVYSSMAVYQRPADADRYTALYDRSRQTQGVRYVGSVAQRDLATALRSATVLSYPNTFAETSCIAAMEALAAGLRVVTSDLAALPETTMGLADLVPRLQGPDDLNRFANEFFGKLRTALDEHRRDPHGFAERAYDQVQIVNRTCTWALRAIEWENAIGSWLAARKAL